MKKSRKSTLVERIKMAEMNIKRLTGEIEYHANAASQLRRQREWAKQRLARARASLVKEVTKV